MWHKGIILVAIPLIFEIFFISVLSWYLFRAEQEARRIEDSRNLILETEVLQRMFYDAGSALIGYDMTKNPLFQAQFGEAKAKILVQLGLLADLAGQNEVRRQNVKEISDLVQKQLKHLEEIGEKMDRDEFQTSSTFADLPTSINRFAELFEDLIRRERAIVAEAPEAESRSRAFVEQWLYMGVAVNILIALGLVPWFQLGTAKRLAVLMDNASRLSAQEALLPPLTGEDEIGKLDSVFHEMADALAQSTRKERAIVENAADVICSINEDLKFSAINPACEVQWGYERKELLGRSVVDIIFEKNDPGLDNFKQAIKEKKDGTFEIELCNKKGRPIDTLWSVHWSDAENRLFCVAHDITDRKRAEQLRRDVVAMVSHDLRSPLTSIQVSLDILEAGVKGPLPPGALSELKKLSGSTSRMVRLVNDFLDLEKLQSGKLDLQKTKTNLDVLVANSINAVRQLAELKEITFREEGLDIDFTADGDRIIQVLVNLISNAIKFAPERSEIAISGGITDGAVEVQVIDQGPGISLHEQENIFQKFEQLDTGRMPGSSGLGLSICKNLVELHGGRIGVRSQPGQGSTFWFRIPYEPEAPGS